MFTGIVETRATVLRVRPRGTGLDLWIATPEGWEPRTGESICVSGGCLSVAESDGASMRFEISKETVDRTWFSALEEGDEVNLERAVRLTDRLDGHLVTGHVDGRGRIEAVLDVGDGGRRMTIGVEPSFERWLVPKGSVAVDGISLTVIEPRGRLFDVAVIPITLERTTLALAEPGRGVNLEADPIGKWIERLVSARL